MIKKKLNLITIEEKIVLKNYAKKKESANEIITREKKEFIPLTQEEIHRYNKQEICYICKEKFCLDKMMKIMLIES